jgi:hypothetical protein
MRQNACSCGVLVLIAGCQQVFGLTPPTLEKIDASSTTGDGRHAHDGSARDSADGPGKLVAPLTQAVAQTADNGEIALDLNPAPSIGDTLILVGGCDPVFAPVTPSGGGVTTWHQVGGSTGASSLLTAWYGVVNTNMAIDSVHLDNVADTGAVWANLTAWTGTLPFDVAHDATGVNGDAADSVATTLAPDLVLFAVEASTAATDGPGWAMLDSVGVNADQQVVWYTTAASTGSVSATATATGNWVALIAAFQL